MWRADLDNFEKEEVWYRNGSSFSGLFYDEETRHLYVMDYSENVIYECGLEGILTETIGF